MPSADSYVAFLERLLTTCGIDSADRRNRSTSVLEWGVVDKQSDLADLAVIAKERVLEMCPRLPIPNRVGYCLSLVSRHSLEE